MLVYNDTIVHCGTGISVAFTAAATNAVVRRKNVLCIGTTEATITNSTTNETVTNHFNTTNDVSFVQYSASPENLRLTSADTVARNLGTDLSGVSDWPFSIDADLTTRPVGSAWDIGAHEELTVDGRVFFATFL